MNYKKIYDNLIFKAQNRKLIDEYFEKHHILPKSMGGSNCKSNLVNLSAREHYLAHWLLYKIYNNAEMAFAWNMLSSTESNNHKGRKRQTSKKYEYSKKVFSKHISNIHKGKKLSPEHRKKISDSKIGDKNPMYGKKHSDEHKKYLSDINTGENNSFYGKTHTNEVKKRISESAKKRVGEKSNAYGYKHTDENKKLFSDMYKGKPRAKPHKIVKCPHCDKSGIKPNMIRWHFDKCKQKEKNI